MKTSWVKECLEMVAGSFLSSSLTSRAEPLWDGYCAALCCLSHHFCVSDIKDSHFYLTFSSV